MAFETYGTVQSLPTLKLTSWIIFNFRDALEEYETRVGFAKHDILSNIDYNMRRRRRDDFYVCKSSNKQLASSILCAKKRLKNFILNFIKLVNFYGTSFALRINSFYTKKSNFFLFQWIPSKNKSSVYIIIM